MPGLVDAKGPSYISSHSGDVILSDIRPTKLKSDALRAINILLDEFLYKILSISGSLATDKLRASLLGLLPTSLGKEALLEAEVELRAYRERMDGSRTLPEDDSRTFHLQWAFELLRLKCEAYSTLNEQDEDPNLEGRVSEKLGKAHPPPPKVGLVDPAALYLTAILESICEHILSNVGRVVARDSSRTNATINDLFVALCEDDSIYGLFKTMKIYEQIETMSKAPQPKRSRSITRNDPIPIPRTSSPHHDLTLVDSSSGSRSLDRQSASTHPSSSGSGTSFEKSRAIRMFVNSNNKVSNERNDDSQSAHKKSESLRSETSRQGDDIPNIAEDAAMLRKFDDLMRSTSTMKMSLTPDRLRTMEVYKQEKDGRPAVHPSLSKPLVPEAHAQKPALVDSIIEDEEENQSPARARQSSTPTQAAKSPSSFSAIIPSRVRSISTSSAGIRSGKKLVRSPSGRTYPSYSYRIPVTEMIQSRDVRKGSNMSLPVRTLDRQSRRESLDADDTMNGSDDDGDQVFTTTKQNLSPPATQRSSRAQYHVSAQTQELIAFLAEGPPEPKLSQSGSDQVGFLPQGPPEYRGSATMSDLSKPKGAGRLQRMISKLSIGGEKVKGSDMSKPTPSTPARSTFSHASLSIKQPVTPVRDTPPSSLANRPIPPRRRPLSPPPSPEYSPEDKSIRTPPRTSHQDTTPSLETPLIERSVAAKPVPVFPATMPSNQTTPEKPIHHPMANVNRNARNGRSPKESSSLPQSLVRMASRKAVPTITPLSSPFSPSNPSSPSAPFSSLTSVFTETDAQDIQRLFTNATTADECRLIFDMFMARNGVANGSAPETDAPYPSPSPSVMQHAPLVHSNVGEAFIESTLVELFLGGTATPDVISPVPSEQNQPDATIEALPGTIEAQADVTPADDAFPSNRSFVHPIPQHPLVAS